MPTVEEQCASFSRQFAAVQAEVGKVVVGQDRPVEGVITGLIAEGHVLLEGVPGLGKTLIVRTLAQALRLQFSRIQFTPDLMPADITGTTILGESDDGKRAFQFQPGPVFANIVLADEINRATPKTQSAMLEAMQEHSTTVAGIRHALPEPFFVLATQNPIEMEGTYPLPEAQLDRFMLKVLVPSPTAQELETIIDRTTGSETPEAAPVLGADEVLAMRQLARDVPLAQTVKQFAIRIIRGTHPDSDVAPDVVRRYVRLGSSPRGLQAIVSAAKVSALLDGRYNVAEEDIVKWAFSALRHRLILNFEGMAEAIEPDAIVTAVVEHARAADAVRIGV